MQGLIVHMPMAMVGTQFHQLAMTWPTWESFTHTPPPLEGTGPGTGKVHFRYDGAYDSERVLRQPAYWTPCTTMRRRLATRR